MENMWRASKPHCEDGELVYYVSFDYQTFYPVGERPESEGVEKMRQFVINFTVEPCKHPQLRETLVAEEFSIEQVC